MGPGGSLDPVWTLMMMFSIVEIVIVAALVAPMPSNAARGAVQGAVSKFWHTQEYVQRTSWVLLTLNCYYLYDSMRNLLEHNKIYAGSCDNQLMSLYLQRNALISGGSVFLFLVMRRLLDIQGQLFEMRSLVKEAAAQAEAPKLLDGPGASEQQRLLKSTLSRLDRGLESGGSFAKERVGVKTA